MQARMHYILSWPTCLLLHLACRAMGMGRDCVVCTRPVLQSSCGREDVFYSLNFPLTVKLCFCAWAISILQMPQRLPAPTLKHSSKPAHAQLNDVHAPAALSASKLCVEAATQLCSPKTRARHMAWGPRWAPRARGPLHPPACCWARPYMQAPGSSPKQTGLRGAWGDAPREQRDGRAAQARPRAAAAGHPGGGRAAAPCPGAHARRTRR